MADVIGEIPEEGICLDELDEEIKVAYSRQYSDVRCSLGSNGESIDVRVMHVCSKCGALIADQSKHSDWHGF